MEIQERGLMSVTCKEHVVLAYIDGTITILTNSGKVINVEIPETVWDLTLLFDDKPYALVYDRSYKLYEIDVRKRKAREVQRINAYYTNVKVRGKNVLMGDVLMRLEKGKLVTLLRDVEAIDEERAVIRKGRKRFLVNLKSMKEEELNVNERIYCLGDNLLIFGDYDQFVGDIEGNKFYTVDTPSCLLGDVVYSRDKVFLAWTPTKYERVGDVIQMVKCGNLVYVVTSEGLSVFEKDYSLSDVMISKLPLKTSFKVGKYYLRTKANLKKIGEGGEKVGLSERCVAIYKTGKLKVICNGKEKVYHIKNVNWIEGKGEKIAIASDEAVYVVDEEGYLDACYTSAKKAKILGNKVVFFSPSDGSVGVCERTWRGLNVTNIMRIPGVIDVEVGKSEIYLLLSTYETYGVHVEVRDEYLEYLETFTIPSSRTICFKEKLMGMGDSLHVFGVESYDLVFRYSTCKKGLLISPTLGIYTKRRVWETLIPTNDSDQGDKVVVTNPYGTYELT